MILYLITIDSQNGRIIFTTKEPFELLFSKLSNTSSTENYNDAATYNVIKGNMSSEYVS
jgi:hypothetical protein